MSPWPGMVIQLAAGGFVFTLLAGAFYAGMMGGGDVKLLTVALLWTGLHCALIFAILLLVFSCLHTAVVKIKGAATKKSNGGARTRIPFAPSIAAALVGVIMLGCLRVPA